VAEHEEQERKRLDAERERIRQEEAQKAEQREKERARQMRNDVPQMQRVDRVPPATDTEWPQVVTPAPAVAGSDALVKLGDINAAIAPLSISAAGLESIGIKPTDSSGRAKMYRVADATRAFSMLRTMLQCHANERIHLHAKE